jgi:hypothetical protein
MTTTKIPQFGDPEILPRGTVTRPSKQRMPFTTGGILKADGPGPNPDDFLLAPDIEGLPYTRRPEDAWTTPEFRTILFAFIVSFFDARKEWVAAWDVVEKASAERMSVARLPEDQFHLVIGVEDKSGKRFEVAVAFAPDARENNLDAMQAVLARAAQSIDVQQQSA